MSDWRKKECCGTCKHWDLNKVKHKNGAVPERGLQNALLKFHRSHFHSLLKLGIHGATANLNPDLWVEITVSGAHFTNAEPKGATMAARSKEVDWRKVAARMKWAYEKEFWSDLFLPFSNSHHNARAVAIKIYQRALTRSRASKRTKKEKT